MHRSNLLFLLILTVGCSQSNEGKQQEANNSSDASAVNDVATSDAAEEADVGEDDADTNGTPTCEDLAYVTSGTECGNCSLQCDCDDGFPLSVASCTPDGCIIAADCDAVCALGLPDVLSCTDAYTVGGRETCGDGVHNGAETGVDCGGVCPACGWSCADVHADARGQCEALVALYESTNGSEWIRADGWLSGTDICRWYGVECWNEPNRVQELDLSANGLSGTIGPEIDGLTYLRFFDVSENALQIIAPEVANLAELEELRLHRCQFTGTIPSSLGDLPRLEKLLLSENQFSGPIPPELGQLTTLTELVIDHNQLSGPIPPEFDNMTSLRRLQISSNQISGPVPDFAGTSLKTLTADSNQFTGTLPAELGNLQTLRWVTLRNNRLSGEIPVEMMNLGDPTVFNLDGQDGCLTAASPELAAWLDEHSPGWNDGCL